MRSLAFLLPLLVATPLAAQTHDPFCGPDAAKPLLTLIDTGDWAGTENLFEVATTRDQFKTMVLTLNRTGLTAPKPETIDKWISGRQSLLGDRVLLSEIADNSFAIFGLALNAATFRGSVPALQNPKLEEGVIHLPFGQKIVTAVDRTTQEMKTGKYWIFATTPEFLEELGLDSLKGQKFVFEPINDPEKRTFPFVAPATD